jgi:SAM-dependent methyltransferase
LTGTASARTVEPIARSSTQQPVPTSRYMIRGGLEGRERLRVLARAMRPTTTALLDRVGVESGWSCLDAGCGGGDVTLELARRAAPDGRVLGVDIDESKLELARAEAEAEGLGNVTYEARDLSAETSSEQFDLVYARFLVTHLPDGVDAVRRLAAAVRPGGLLALEDVDFEGSFCYPPSAAYDVFVDIYVRTAVARGGDPLVGRRLPWLVLAAGCEDVDVSVVHPVGRRTDGWERDVKLLVPLTLENIADAAVAEGIATRVEIDAAAQELDALVDDPGALLSVPRIVQTVGRVPAGR